MSGRKIVIALGGNAILSGDASAKAQRAAVEATANQLVKLVAKGDRLIISHGNGPQVGNLYLQQEAAASLKNPAMPLDTCVAMTQGSIGYWLENALLKALKANQLEKEVAVIMSQVLVDSADPAFQTPTKPIGPFLTQAEAKVEMAHSDTQFIEDAGRGWRKVVPSPKPISIREHRVINALVEQDIITVAVGGGGIPVIADGLVGVEAVVDKDFASEKLAELVDADLLVILTGVQNVYLNYGQDNQVKLEQVTIQELEQHIQGNQFAKGSMLPKIEAAIEYVKAKPKRKAIITSLENIANLVNGETGTVIVA